MVIDNLDEYDKIWDWIYKNLNFSPSVYKEHDFADGYPFQIPFVHTIYGIDRMNNLQLDIMDDVVEQALLNATKEGKRLYALDWQHSGFLYNPRIEDEKKSAWVDDINLPNGGYNAFFPCFYPDGDYYFFIDEHLEFGYLSHPWRKEVWIFGEALVKEFEKIYLKLGWYKV